MSLAMKCSKCVPKSTRTPNTLRPVGCRVPLAARYLAFAAGSRSIRVMCRIATCFTKSSGAFVDFPATPMNTVEPNTHANSGWGTSWLEPSDRNRRKALNGLAWRYSRIWGAVITENKYPLQAADARASTLLVTFSGERPEMSGGHKLTYMNPRH
jgi:hypothetical protein